MVLALALSAALALGGLDGILPANSVYADPRIPGMLAVVSLYGLVSGFESTKVYLARRHLVLAQLTKIDLLGQALGTGFVIAWAFVSPSVWALALGWVFGALVKTILTHTALPGDRNRWQWSASAQEVFHFGKWTVLSSIFSFLLSSGDRLLLGAILNAATMGFYSIAGLLLSAVQSAISKVVGYAVLPALSEVARSFGRAISRRRSMWVRRPLDLVCLLAAGCSSSPRRSFACCTTQGMRRRAGCSACWR